MQNRTPYMTSNRPLSFILHQTGVEIQRKCRKPTQGISHQIHPLPFSVGLNCIFQALKLHLGQWYQCKPRSSLTTLHKRTDKYVHVVCVSFPRVDFGLWQETNLFICILCKLCCSRWISRNRIDVHSLRITRSKTSFKAKIRSIVF